MVAMKEGEEMQKSMRHGLRVVKDGQAAMTPEEGR